MRKLLLLFLLLCNTYLAFSNATVAQKSWRWRKDDGDEATATWLKAKNTTLTTLPCNGTDTLRLRIAFEVEYDHVNPSFGASKTTNGILSYSTLPTGTYTMIPYDATVNQHFQMVTSKYISASTSTNVPTTQQISTGGYGAGAILDDSSIIYNGAYFSTNAGATTIQEFEWVFTPTVDAIAQTYYFKLEGLDAYDAMNMPQLKLTGPICNAIINPISEKTITIYPNPVSKEGNVMLSSSDANVRIEKITLFDKQQKEIATVSKMEELNTKNLEAGMYMLEIVTDKGVTMKKLLLE